MKPVDKKYNFLVPCKNENLERLGKSADGGYVVDGKIVTSCSNLISFGLGPDWSFELDYIKKNNNVKIYVYDHTVSAIPYIKDVLKYLKRFILFKKKYEAFSSRCKHLYNYLSFKKLKHVNFFAERIICPPKKKNDADIKKVFSRLSSESKVVLKCDIEGGEYKIIDEILNFSERIEMLIFEFHSIGDNEKIFLSKIKQIIEKFNIVHIHGNNHEGLLLSGLPETIEITMINKRHFIKNNDLITSFPIEKLDHPNNPHVEDLKFFFKIN